MELHQALSLPASELESAPVHVNFVGRGEGGVKMAIVQVFLQVLQFLTVIIIPAVLHTNIFHLPNTDGLHALQLMALLDGAM
jgi:hypothetical protein